MFLKPARAFIAGFLMIYACSCFAQSVIIEKGIYLPQDSVARTQLIGSLNGFLSQKEQANKDNKFVLKEDLLETSALLDELKGLESSRIVQQKDFFKPYLTNVVKTGDDSFVVQFAYIGINDNQPFLRASFRLLAKKRDNQYYFSSPLKMNTLAWKTKKINNITFHFKDTLPVNDAKAYQKLDASYDKRLEVPVLPVQFYYCDNIAEVLQLLGIDYKQDYNSSSGNIFTSRENNERLAVSGWGANTTQLYAHDLWHSHLHSVVSVEVINRPVDEGCAYLYGGSWGLSWKTILTTFNKYAADNPNADWLSLYTSSQKLSGDDKPVYIGYVLNALIIQKIESEKGFSQVIPLVSCGKRQTGDDNYFAALDRITGINKTNFNAKMWELIKKEQ